MENMTMKTIVTAMAAQFVNETGSSPEAATSTVGWYILCILLTSMCLFMLLIVALGLLGLGATGIVALSYAAMWMYSVGIVAARSLFAWLQSIAMGGVPLVDVLNVLKRVTAVVTVAVGAFKAVELMVHMWESDGWDSVTASGLHVWHSGDGILEWWNGAVAWVQHLWNSIPVHHKWKILY